MWWGVHDVVGTGENVCMSWWWGSMVVWARVFSLPVFTSVVMLQGSLGYEQCCHWFVATGLISYGKGPSEYFGKRCLDVWCAQNLSALFRKIIPVCAVFLLCWDHSPIQLLPSWGLDSSQVFHNDKIKLALWWVVHVKFLSVKAHCLEYFLAGFFFFFLVRIQHLVFERERRKDADEEMLLFKVQGGTRSLFLEHNLSSCDLVIFSLI